MPQNEWCNNKDFLQKIEKYLINSNILKELNVNINIDKNNPMFWKYCYLGRSL